MAAGGVVARSKVLLVIDINRALNLSCFNRIGRSHEVITRRLRSNKPLFESNPLRRIEIECRSGGLRRIRHCRHLSSQASPLQDTSQTNRLVVEYRRGLPQVRVPLPSNSQDCLFTLRPISNTVGDFLQMLRTEDKALSSVAISTIEDVRIASSNTIESLMEEDFKLILNDKVFYVKIPETEKKAKEKELERLADIRALVNQLYLSLNVEEHVVKKEREIVEQLEQLKLELEPLEKKKEELDAMAVRRTTALTWIGLGLMSVQFGILARLTWWEYSWDIMEPVTYFVTYGTAMAAYAYFVLTKQEYLLPDVRDRQHLITVHKRARKIGLDLRQYNRLKELVSELECELGRLREAAGGGPGSAAPGHPRGGAALLHSSSSPLERTKNNIRAILALLRKK